MNEEGEPRRGGAAASSSGSVLCNNTEQVEIVAAAAEPRAPRQRAPRTPKPQEEYPQFAVQMVADKLQSNASMAQVARECHLTPAQLKNVITRYNLGHIREGRPTRGAQ